MAKANRRVQATQQKIYQAMLTLCHQGTSFEKVSVRVVTQTAGVSRQTFYRYYDSPKSIITQLIDWHLKEFLAEFRAQQLRVGQLIAQEMVTQLLTNWQERTDFFQLIEWSNTRQVFIQGISAFNVSIAKNNHKYLIDAEAICDMYAASIYMFLRSYVLKQRWSIPQATDLLLHLNNNFDQIF